MPNDFTAVAPKIVARGIKKLREKAVFARIFNRPGPINREAAKLGETINVEVPGSIGVRDVAPSVTAPNPVDRVTSTVPLSLNRWRQSDPFHLTDKELGELDVDKHFMPERMEAAVVALAEDVNDFIAGQLTTAFYRRVGTAGTIPFGAAPATASLADGTLARKALNQEKASAGDGRWGVVDHTADAQMLNIAAFRDAEKIGMNDVVMEGEIGRKLGINWIAADAVTTHTTGAATATAIAVDNGAGYPAGTTTMHIDGLTSDPIPGDLFTIAGLNAPNVTPASLQEFVVVSVANFAAGEGDITFYPPLPDAVSDDDALTFVAAHTANLVFHRDCGVFASRPLRDDGDALTFALTDPLTGLTLRLEKSRQHKQTAYELDILYGFAVLQREQGVRLLG